MDTKAYTLSVSIKISIYMFKHLKNDIPASIVVFFVALPLCLGIALASGAPLFAGLIAGTFGLFIFYQAANQVMIQRVLSAVISSDSE